MAMPDPSVSRSERSGDRVLATIHHRVGWIVHYLPAFVGRPLGKILYAAWDRQHSAEASHDHVLKAVSFRNYCYCEGCGEKVRVWESEACQRAFEDGPKIDWSEVPGETRN